MPLSIAATNLAITNETGEGPEGQFIRNRIAPSVFLSAEGKSPLGMLVENPGFSLSGPLSGPTVGSAARFSGQEGETPLGNLIRGAAGFKSA